MIVENKNEITFEEFSAWMVGMIRGKGGEIPDIEDWKEIKKMMDKVVPTKEYVTAPSSPIFPDLGPYNPPPFTPPFTPWVDDHTGTPNFPPGTILCDNTTSDKIVLTTTSSAQENDVPVYIDMKDRPMVGHVTSGFAQVDAASSQYGMSDAIASMEALSNQIRAGE